jgi:hypothetical protein
MSQHPATRLPAAVKDGLRPDLPAEQAPTNRPTRPNRRRRTAVENTDYATFATRVIRGQARRTGLIDRTPLRRACSSKLSRDTWTGRDAG